MFSYGVLVPLPSTTTNRILGVLTLLTRITSHVAFPKDHRR